MSSETSRPPCVYGQVEGEVLPCYVLKLRVISVAEKVEKYITRVNLYVPGDAGCKDLALIISSSYFEFNYQ